MSRSLRSLSQPLLLCGLGLFVVARVNSAATAPARQASGIDVRLRIVDVNTQELLPASDFVLREADGELLAPIAIEDGEFSLFVREGKLLVEPATESPKPVDRCFTLIDVPRVHLTLSVDSSVWRIVEFRQKPDLPQYRADSKTRRPGGGGASLFAPPANNFCGFPLFIGDGPTAFSTLAATTDGPANCSGQIHNDVWFDYVATATGLLTATTCSAANFDTKIAIYAGLGCPAPTPIGCNDDDVNCLNFTSTATASVIAGNHYLIRVGGFSSTSRGTGTLLMTPASGPPFDQCATAQSVSCDSTTNFDNSACSTSASDPDYTCRIPVPEQGRGTSWFTFVATGTKVTIDTEGSAAADTLLGVYSGTCGALVHVACDDDSGTGMLSRVDLVGLTVGQTYYIQVSGWGISDLGDTTLNVRCSHKPALPYSGSLSPVVVTYPVRAWPSLDHARRSGDVIEPGAELVLAVSYPQDEPILSLESAGARVAISDGTIDRVLYQPRPEDEGRTTSVFADLSELFPASTSTTVFHLAARADATPGFLGQPRFHGGTALRRASSANEVALISSRTPRAGEDWEAWVDVSAHPTASASLVWLVDTSLAGRATSFGPLLIDLDAGKPLVTSFVRSSGTTNVHTLRISPEFTGRSLSLQALILDGKRSTLTNALDLDVREP